MGRYFTELGKDYHQEGWITDDGEFIPCASYEHDKIAEERTGQTIPEIEKKWVRISVRTGKNYLQFEGNKINRSQHEALDEWGLNELLEKRRVGASDNFLDAYFK